MSRKNRIGSALALAGALLALAPAAALAGSPLLSGYGGPGAGEQAIVGATLLAGPRGGGSSGGSGGPSNPSGSREELPGSSTGTSETAGTAKGTGSAQAGGSAGSGTGSTSSKATSGKAGGKSQTDGSAGASIKRAEVYVYPSSLTSASSDSSVIGMSSGDVLLLIGTIVGLTLLGAYTLRLARLQH
jgi:hypothetical protein